MGNRRISADGHKLTGFERKRRFDDKAAGIDNDLNQAMQRIDWDRRKAASKSLKDFIKTYMIGILLDDQPSPHAEEVLDVMDYALKDNRPQQLMLPRGSGKTSYAECAALYQLLYGHKKFFVIISNNARAGGNILQDLKRVLVESGTALANDFPEVCVPFALCNGFYRRRQTYNGVDTALQMNASNIIFPRIMLSKSDGELYEMPTSGSIVTSRGMSGGLRGLKIGSKRPDSLILDDLQDADIAASPEQVEKVHNIINRDILNLSSKGKISVIMTATPIEPEDLTDKVRNDPSWKTTIYKAILKWPKDVVDHPDDGLWHKYFELYDSENINDKPHDESLQFYKDNKDAMDEGADLYQPDKFKPSDGHVSGLQALMEKRHLIGPSAFQAEMQMTPKRREAALNITPNIVVSKIDTSIKKNDVPDGYTFVAAAIDLNVSYALTYVVAAFKPDGTCAILHHDLMKCRIDGKLADAAYNAQVYQKLTEVCNRLKAIGLQFNGIAIDAGGRNWNVVCDFCRNSMVQLGLPCCAFAGRANNVFNPYVRSRLRDMINDTVLCGDAQEHLKRNSGQRYVFWNADKGKERVHKALLQPVGTSGCCALYKASTKEHTEFAIQVTNERLMNITKKKDGRDIYEWKTKEPHDALDCTAMCYAVAASQGISGDNFSKPHLKPVFLRRMVAKPKLKIV